jgi:methyl-accepting chemotaxis protein
MHTFSKPGIGIMAGRLEQGIKDWTIRRKILTGFMVVLLLTTLQGWQAIEGLSRVSTAVGGGTLTREATEQMFQDTRFLIVAILAITIVLGFCLALGLARLIADPLTQLGILVEEVSKGDLTTDIKSQSRDEIGWLEHSMRQMVKNLREIASQITTSSRARHIRGGDCRLLDPDGQGGGKSVELDRANLLDDGGDRLSDAATGQERGGAGGQRR